MIYLASDHAGYQLKKRIARFLENELKLPFEDVGPLSYQEDDDYPDYVIPMAQKVAAKKDGRGIAVCANGIGVCIAANKVSGVRAGIGYNMMAAETMRTDDNANVLCLAAKVLSDDHALVIVKKWLETEFPAEERHVRRLKKVSEFEKAS